MSDAWYVLSEEQQLGPYTGEQLVEFAQEGRIIAETMVWADGMAEWVTASQVEGLIPQPVAVATTKPVLATSNWAPPGARAATNLGARVATSASPYQAPVSGYSPVQAVAAGGSYPFFPIKAASFGLWMWSIIGMILAIVFLMISVVGMVSNSESKADQSTMMTFGIIGTVMYLVLFVCSIISMIYFYILLYRSWDCLRCGNPRTTPGQAIGMLFIPLYNIYWLFVAINGLPQDWNRVMASHDDLKAAPRMSEGVFLTFCICSLIFPPVAMIMMFMMVSQMCKGINFFAYRRNQTANATTGVGPSTLGGIKFK